MSNPLKTPTPKQIVQNLHNFNRKERDHLMKFALCEDADKPVPSVALIDRIKEATKLNVPTDGSVFLGMDYHLNWLYAALMLGNEYGDSGISDLKNAWRLAKDQTRPAEGSRPIQGNQQDVDLLLAWSRNENNLNIILIEAKFSSGWNSEQFMSKAERLDSIRKESEKHLGASVKQNWHFILASPGNGAPTREAFSTAKLGKLPSWIVSEFKAEPKLSYIQFGPKRLYQVKRKSEEKPEEWEVVAMKLR